MAIKFINQEIFLRQSSCEHFLRTHVDLSFEYNTIVGHYAAPSVFDRFLKTKELHRQKNFFFNLKIKIPKKKNSVRILLKTNFLFIFEDKFW